MPKFAAEVREKHKIGFEVLSDAHNEIAAKFGLVYTLPEDLRAVHKAVGIDLPSYNGDDSWTLPIPARFVVSQDGIIRKADVDPDYTRRPEPADTIAFLKTLSR